MDKIHPAPSEFTAAQIEADPILRYFHYAYLPKVLGEISSPFCSLAAHIVLELPRNAERSVALRKLLEAKDAAVRANVGELQARSEIFYDRLLAESRELENRIEKLEAFIHGDGYNSLEGDQQGLLGVQLRAMREYADTLGLRIRHLGDRSIYDRTVEEIGAGVRLIGGDQSETPPPFKA